jgi:hypothetical protein
MNFSYQEIIAVIALLMGLVTTTTYITSILCGKTKPHLYSWIVYSILTAIAFFAQVHDHGGPGTWITGITAAQCIMIAFLSIKYGEKNKTTSDKMALITSLSAIIPWLFTDDPLLSVILISIIDAVATYPSIRKSWHKPHEERLLSWNLAAFKNTLSIFALTNMTVTTVLYVATTVVVNCTLIGVCLWRRRVLKNKAI